MNDLEKQREKNKLKQIIEDLEVILSYYRESRKFLKSYIRYTAVKDTMNNLDENFLLVKIQYKKQKKLLNELK